MVICYDYFLRHNLKPLSSSDVIDTCTSTSTVYDQTKQGLEGREEGYEMIVPRGVHASNIEEIIYAVPSLTNGTVNHSLTSITFSKAKSEEEGVYATIPADK